MKTLDQLGISPAPWKLVPYGERTNSKVATHGDVEFANGESAFTKDGGAQLQDIADATLIAAAPELYEALREIVADNKCGLMCSLCGAADKCKLRRAVAALEKAGGKE